MYVSKTSLAIVIPYYKIGYFEELLVALDKQTNKNFKVYIGDDGSPKSPMEILQKYTDKLNIEYQKFEENLGGKDLVAQWHRCLDMVHDEEWVWVLPDDDVPSENVVEEFYKALEFREKYNIKVFRFPMSIIDQHGNVVQDLNHCDPVVETNLDFYQRIVRGEASASLGDNIFHKKSLLESGGFVNFPKAWGSDHATLLQASARGSIYFLEKARLYFRMSGENISSDNSDGLIKLDARIKFAKWLKANEHIFPCQPDEEFYKFFYWKGEYYVLNEWTFSVQMLRKLYELRRICFNSLNILPIVKVALQQIGLLKL